jgi:hypothetical protein
LSFHVFACVIMPEQANLLLSELESGTLPAR